MSKERSVQLDIPLSADLSIKVIKVTKTKIVKIKFLQKINVFVVSSDLCFYSLELTLYVKGEFVYRLFRHYYRDWSLLTGNVMCHV